MAAVNYLKGNEPPTVELMNDLFTALDDKLTRILGGRSFFLAQTAQMPQYLIGKAFFFTAGNAVYAPRVPGYIEIGTAGNDGIDPATGLPLSGSVSYISRPYNHAQFLAAQAAAQVELVYLTGIVSIINGGHGYAPNDILTLVGGTGTAATLRVTNILTTTGAILGVVIAGIGNYSSVPQSPNSPTGGHGGGATFTFTFSAQGYDEVNKVAPIPQVDATYYQGLPLADDVGVFEWSLQAHYLMYQGSSDKTPTKYYLADGTTTPEKHYKYALAEIIIEGVSAVTMEREWDKYSCFRCHNLNAHPVTVDFAGVFTLKLEPFQCATVRRDSATENYRRGFNYFFRYEGGDLRFYWFFPTSGNFIGQGGRAANSMQANNLSNPAMLLDWVQFFTRPIVSTTNWGGAVTVDPATGLPVSNPYGATYASFIFDPTIQCDIYALYKDFFGDPSDPHTLVGDLLHHKGDIKIVRVSKTKREPLTGNPLITFDQVTFNGYATIVQDFALKKLQVSENADGNLMIRNVDPDNDVWLVPISTNLLKLGDDIDGKWRGISNNGAAPSDKGIPLNTYGDVVIENAIFEAEPEQPWLDDSTLRTSGPQLIQQPMESTTTLQKIWYDIYNIQTYEPALGQSPPPDAMGIGGSGLVDVDPATGGNIFGYFPAQIVKGKPQTTLNWDTNARGLLTTPIILDGGSGYEVGDVEQLAGGSGEPASVIVTAAINGRVTGIQIAYIGNYASAPPNPNHPANVYPTDRSGSGLILGGINVPVKTLNGIHKVSVADLLKLDWWGDPRAGDQSSNYVHISDRKLMLTPQGLVLTFTETDSPLPGDSALQPASLPTWASGKRGLPRHRAIRFRGHGWGFVGGGNDTENIISVAGGQIATIHVPPSAKSGMVSPRYSRYEVSGGYKGEVVAPNGGDFTEATKKKRGAIKMLTRVKAATLTLASSPGRFWRAAGIDKAANFLPQPGGSPAPYFFQTWFFIPYAAGYPANGIAMALLPEMYNALAQAMNSLTSGIPLKWQCLYFNVGGKIVSLDPLFANSGNTPGGSGFAYYNGPRPINQFASFDQGSVYHELCDQLRIPVYMENHLPGGSASFSYYQTKFSAPAVYCDFVQSRSNGDTGCTPADANAPGTWSPFDPDFNLSWVDKFYGTVTTTITTELLSTSALLKGRATGSRCAGTYDPAKYEPGYYDAATQSWVGAYPDFSNASPGAYFVANDGSGIVLWNGGSTNVFDQPIRPGQAYYANGNWVDLANGFQGYRWIQIEDVQRAVQSFGFSFLWEEICTPLELKYFEDPTEQSTIANQSSAVGSWTTNMHGKMRSDAYAGAYDYDFNLRKSVDDWMSSSIADVNALTASALAFSNSGLPGHGTLIKFCVTEDATKAKWKIGALGAPTTASNNGPVNGCPAEIVNVKSRQRLSPFFRYLNGLWDLGISGSPNGFSRTGWSPGLSVQVGGLYIVGQDKPFYIQTGQRPTSISDYPQLAVQYVPKIGTDFSALLASNYNEGSLLDQYQVFAFNIYSSQPIAPISVLLSGIAAWKKQNDWWGNMDAVHAAFGGTDGLYNFNGQYDSWLHVPWAFVPPPPSLSLQITNYFGGGGQNGLTIVSAKDAQRYWCCFSPTPATIPLN